MLKAGDAALLYSGVAVNLLALRHEICTVLVIEDPRWYERESGDLRMCDEFLQQCEQAELLPDQRWVQLISLTRPGLEVEPMWWDRCGRAPSWPRARPPSSLASRSLVQSPPDARQ